MARDTLPVGGVVVAVVVNVFGFKKLNPFDLDVVAPELLLFGLLNVVEG
jgi:hypothetical protein